MLDSFYEINDTSSCGGFLKMILINSVDFVHRFRDISRFNIVRVIWKEVALENLSTNVGEKVARRWFASRFAAGACAGCAVQISRAFRVSVRWFLVSSTQMRLIFYRELLSGRHVHISKLFFASLHDTAHSCSDYSKNSAINIVEKNDVAMRQMHGNNYERLRLIISRYCRSIFSRKF